MHTLEEDDRQHGVLEGAAPARRRNGTQEEGEDLPERDRHDAISSSAMHATGIRITGSSRHGEAHTRRPTNELEPKWLITYKQLIKQLSKQLIKHLIKQSIKQS